MSTLLKNKYVQILLPLVVFGLIGFLILTPVFFSPGIITGGDWTFPYTFQQLKSFLVDRVYSWGKIELVGGYRIFLVDLPFALFMRFLGYTPLAIPSIPKLILWFAYMFAGISMFAFLRYLRLGKISAYIGGLVYITSPFFFNYTVMGWIYVLLSMAIFPVFLLLFDKSVAKNSMHHAVAAGMLFSLAFMQSTSLFWYSIGMFALGLRFISDIPRFKRFVSGSIIVGLILVLTHSYWVYNLFIYKDNTVFGSSNVLSSVSLGTWTHLNMANLVRGWGSLFNYTYEYSFSSGLLAASFAVTVLAVLGIYYSKSLKHYKAPLVFILIVPFLMFFVGPERISKLPFANVIRDVARMSVLISFSLTVLVAGFFDFLISQKKIILALIAGTAVFLSMNPFWTGAFFKEQDHIEDIRLRTYEYPGEFITAENYLEKNAGMEKVFYVSTTPSFSDFSNKDYRGPYREMSYVFGSMSPKQGLIFTSDKEDQGINGYYGNLIDQLKYNYDKSIDYILSTLNIRYMVFYFNAMFPSDWLLYKNVSGSDRFKDITRDVLGKESGVLAIYEVNSPSLVIESADPIIADISTEDSIRIESNVIQNIDAHLFIPLDRREIESSDVYASSLGNKFEFNPNLIHPGWSWPQVGKKPGTLLYKFVKTKEWALVKMKTNEKDRLDLLLWLASKRAEEVKEYPGVDPGPLVEDFNQKYTEILDLLAGIDEEDRGAWYFGFISQLNYFFSKAGELIPIDPGLAERVKSTIADAEKSYKGEVDIQDKTPFLLYRNQLVEDSVGEDPDELREVMIDFKEFGDADSVIRSSAAQNLISGHLEAMESVLPAKLYKEISKKIPAAKFFEIQNWLPDQDYEISFDLLNDSSPILFFIIEDVQDIRKDFIVGAGQENIKYSPKLTVIKYAESSEKIAPEDRFTELFDIESNPLANKAYLYILPEEVDDEITATSGSIDSVADFEIAKVNKPDLIYVNTDSIKLDSPPAVTFSKINQTKYTVNVDSADTEFGLILKQRFSRGWKVFAGDSNVPLDESYHYVSDGYANGWIINSDRIPENGNFVVEFTPQRSTIVGFWIAGLTFLIAIGYLFYGILNKGDNSGDSVGTGVESDPNSSVNQKFAVVQHILTQHGLGSLKLILNRAFTYLYYLMFKQSKFDFKERKYPYFYHWYNVTFRNERCVEIPLAEEKLRKFNGKEILEVGNVLSHYFDVDHTVLDKYEESFNTIRQDIVEFSPGKKYDLILSVSTLEHVGWDEEVKDRTKFKRALDHMSEDLLKPGGELLVTMPIGWSSFVDEFVRRGEFGNYDVGFMKRVSKDNRWKQANLEEVTGLEYGKPFPNANGLIIIER